MTYCYITAPVLQLPWKHTCFMQQKWICSVKKRPRWYLEVNFYLMVLMNERVKKNARPWACQQGQSHDPTAWCHMELPQLLVQGPETTLVLHPTGLSAPWASQVYISSGKNLHQSKYTPSRTVASSFKTTQDMSPRHIIVSWQHTAKHIPFNWNLMRRGPTWW